LTGFYNRGGVCLLHGTDWMFKCNSGSTLKTSCHYTYHQFNIDTYYVLPTLCLCVLCWAENKQRLIPYTALTDWFL